MNRTVHVMICLGAGLLGGVLSRWIIPTPVLAQAPAPAAAAPQEIRAQQFTLVTEDGRILGTFGYDHPRGLGNNPGRKQFVNDNAVPTIKLFDAHGRETWSAGGSPIRTLGER